MNGFRSGTGRNMKKIKNHKNVKYRALLWLIPVLYVLIKDIDILVKTYNEEFSSVSPGGHPSGLLTVFMFVIVLIPTVIITLIFSIITIVRFVKLSKKYDTKIEASEGAENEQKMEKK